MNEHAEPSHSEEISHLEGWDRTFWLSRAYMEASFCLCTNMIKGDFSSQYSSSRVILHLVRQGIELFLKAAIEVAGKSADGLGHDLNVLCAEYWQLYRDQSFHFSVPERFLVSTSHELFPDTMGHLRATMDQRHRYAKDKRGATFASPEVFEPDKVLEEILELQRVFGILEWAKIRRKLSTPHP